MNKLFATYKYFARTRSHQGSTMKFVLLLTIFITSNANSLWLFGPNDFEDCVIEYTKSTYSELARLRITASCSSYFSDEGSKNPSLDKCFIQKLQGASTDTNALLAAGKCYKENK